MKRYLAIWRKVSFFAASRASAGHRGSGSFSAPPCGTGLSAALKPRRAGLHPSGFHPWRKESGADALSVPGVRAVSASLRVRVWIGFAATG